MQISKASTAVGAIVEDVDVTSLSDQQFAGIRQAFLDHGAVQCGFCTPGFLMTLTALVETEPDPTPRAIRDAIAGNICRCTGYQQMIDAVLSVASDGAGS